MKRYRTNRLKDKKIFKRTALQTRAANVMGVVSRGGIRL